MDGDWFSTVSIAVAVYILSVASVNFAKAYRTIIKESARRCSAAEDLGTISSRVLRSGTR